MQPGAVAVADEDEGPRPGLQHIGEVLRAHHRRNVGTDIALARDIGGDPRGNLRFRRVIDQNRIATLVVERDLRARQLRHAVDDFADTLLDQVAHLRR